MTLIEIKCNSFKYALFINAVPKLKQEAKTLEIIAHRIHFYILIWPSPTLSF